LEITLASLFDGIGGFPLAGQRNGITAIWASEIEPFPIKVTKIRFPQMKHYGDITKINGVEVEPVDIITGGSPCQDLSVAGKRAGLAGARSGLFMEQVRIVKEMRENDQRNGRTGKFIRPRFMVWENVPGAFSSNKGEDFRAVVEEVCRVKDPTLSIPRPPKDKWNRAGCIMGNGFSVAWRILDAQFWGVPQRRRRIFLVADFGGQSAPEVLFKREGLSRYLAEGRKERERIAADVERGVGKAIPINTQIATRGNKLGERTGFGVGVEGGPSFTLQEAHSHAVAYGICSYASNSMKSDNPHSGIYEANTSRTLDLNGGSPACNQGGIAIVQQINCPPSGIAKTFSFQRSDEFKETDKASTQSRRQYKDATDLVCSVDCRNMYENAELSGTLQSKENGGQSLNYQNPVRIGYSVRRLTPLECDRLQDYPDGWTDIPGASDSARYKADGNSVAVCCPDYVLEGIKLEILKEFAFLE